MLHCLQSFKNIHFNYATFYGFMFKILEEIKACMKLLTMELYFTTLTLNKKYLHFKIYDIKKKNNAHNDLEHNI